MSINMLKIFQDNLKYSISSKFRNEPVLICTNRFMPLYRNAAASSNIVVDIIFSSMVPIRSIYDLSTFVTAAKCITVSI